jgi:hypothetical protein
MAAGKSAGLLLSGLRGAAIAQAGWIAAGRVGRREYLSRYGLAQTWAVVEYRTRWEEKRMAAFVAEVNELYQTLQRLPFSDVRALEKSLDDRETAQRGLVRDTLQQARIEGRLPIHELNLLEYLVERWDSYNLPLKLAITARLARIFDTVAWPEDMLSAYPAVNTIVRRDALSVS